MLDMYYGTYPDAIAEYKTENVRDFAAKLRGLYVNRLHAKQVGEQFYPIVEFVLEPGDCTRYEFRLDVADNKLYMETPSKAAWSLADGTPKRAMAENMVTDMMFRSIIQMLQGKTQFSYDFAARKRKAV